MKLWAIALTSCTTTASALAMHGGTPGESFPRFPTAATKPAAVMVAQLRALRDGDIPKTYELFSRARKLQLEESSRRDMRERTNPARVHKTVRAVLEHNCPGLIGHKTCEIVASLGNPEPEGGLLPIWRYRVKIDGSRHYLVTLTRQSDWDGGDPRDRDGFERCWFVWTIEADDDRGGNVKAPTSPVPVLA